MKKNSNIIGNSLLVGALFIFPGKIFNTQSIGECAYQEPNSIRKLRIVSHSDFQRCIETIPTLISCNNQYLLSNIQYSNCSLISY